jgi:ribosomal protein S18 acetylase RimI-like enzyme
MGINVRPCRRPEAPTVLELWTEARSEHASKLYRLAVRKSHRREGIALALTRAGEEYLHGCGARRVTALVAFDDEVAGGFWDSAGYPIDTEIGRRVRNI